MFFKIASVLALVALSSVATVSAQPKPSSSSAFTSIVGPLTQNQNQAPVYSFAAITPPSDACNTCLDNNINSISDCKNIQWTSSITSVSQLTDQQKKCICSVSKSLSSTWSKGCVSTTLCDQSTVDTLVKGLATLQPQVCVAGTANMACGSRSGATAAAAVALGTVLVYAL
jgi:hypothetical protein